MMSRFLLRSIRSESFQAKLLLELRQPFFLPATGQEAIVANANKAFGQDMLAEPADKLLVRQRHFQFLCTFTVIFVTEGKLPTIHTFDPMITDGNLVGVPAQILYHCLWTLEWSFGIYHPRFDEQAIEESFALLRKLLSQSCHKSGSENTAHGFHWKKIFTLTSGRLPMPCRGDTAPRHNTM